MLGKFAVEASVLDEDVVLFLQYFLLLFGDLVWRNIAEETGLVDKQTVLGEHQLCVLNCQLSLLSLGL